MSKIENILNKNINEFFIDEDLEPLDYNQDKISINKLEDNKSIIEIDNISMPEIEKEIILMPSTNDEAKKDNWLKDDFFNKENYDLIKDIEYKDDNFKINLFSEEENIYLDAGGNDDGSKGFILCHTLAFDDDSNKYINIDISELQNGLDYRGSDISINKSLISEWNGTDPLRFDLKYIDMSGKEFIDHYYYDLVNGLSNKPSVEKLAGEADLFLFKDYMKESDDKNYIFLNNNESQNVNEMMNIGLSTNYIVHDQVERKFLLYIPSSYEEDSNYPLLLNFHGGSSTALDQLNIADMRKLSDDNGFILCYPEGTSLESGELHWNPTISVSNSKSTTNDISFVDFLINYLKENLSIDSSKIYATGYSNGAGLAYSLGFYLSEKIAAVAPVSGSMYEYINNQIVDFENTSVINFNGDSDYERPFEGIEGWFNSVPDSVDFWTETNEITNEPIVERLSTENGQEIEYSHAIDTEKNIGVESYKIINGGHDWFDFTLNGNSFNEIIWNSLSKYSQEENISNTKSDLDPILIDFNEKEPQPTPELTPEYIPDPIKKEVTEPYQTVSTSSDEISFYPGKDINFDLVYTTSDNESALTGLGLKVHYDSSLFTPSRETNGVSALVNTLGDPAVVVDTDNFDNDENTDKYIAITWADFFGNFPGGELPATLASLSFASSETGFDSLTGELKESKINFTSTDPAQNYDFLSQSVALKPQSFNLDVDGDGSVTALGDGLMVIRKLFGAAFADDALTSKAISNNATRTTTEIHEFIQAGMDEKVLDVDGDGSVTALGDGLMVIRKLFGAAFAGDGLTSKAISNNATRTTDEIHEYIAAMSDVGSMV